MKSQLKEVTVTRNAFKITFLLLYKYLLIRKVVTHYSLLKKKTKKTKKHLIAYQAFLLMCYTDFGLMNQKPKLLSEEYSS